MDNIQGVQLEAAGFGVAPPDYWYDPEKELVFGVVAAVTPETYQRFMQSENMRRLIVGYFEDAAIRAFDMNREDEWPVVAGKLYACVKLNRNLVLLPSARNIVKDDIGSSVRSHLYQAVGISPRDLYLSGHARVGIDEWMRRKQDAWPDKTSTVS